MSAWTELQEKLLQAALDHLMAAEELLTRDMKLLADVQLLRDPAPMYSITEAANKLFVIRARLAAAREQVAAALDSRRPDEPR